MIRLFLAVMLLAPTVALAAPAQWSWTGVVSTPGMHSLTPSTWPPPAQWLGEQRQCTGMLSVSFRSESGGASWIQPVAILFGDSSVPAFIRVMSPPPNIWLVPQWAHAVSSPRVQVGAGAVGVEIRVDGVGAWSATFTGDCAWL